jgi:hypothetical protein
MSAATAKECSRGRVLVLPWDKHVSAGIEIELDQLSQKFPRGSSNSLQQCLTTSIRANTTRAMTAAPDVGLSATGSRS